MSWRGPLAVFFYLAAEALLWFIALRSFATGLERSAFRELATAIESGIAAGDFLEPDRALTAQELAERAGEHATGGPSLLLLVLLAAGAFALMRTMARAELPVSVRAAIGLLVSFAAVGLALQIALADGPFWDGGVLSDLRGQSTYTGPIDPVAFVANPDVDRVRGASRAVVIGGISLLWLRFLIAGRGPVTFERSLRGFGIGFGVAVVVAFLAAASDADVATWLVMPYFVLGALSLAAAHAARAPEDETAIRREAPWVISLLGTLVGLTALTAVFALLALLDAQRLFEPVGEALATVVLWTLIIVLTPIIYLVDFLLSPFLHDVQLPNVQEEVQQAVGEGNDGNGGLGFPGWTGNLVRGALVVGAIWVAYQAARWLFERSRRRHAEAHVEVRRSEESGGLGSMLRTLIPRPRRRRRPDWGWLERSRAHRLFGRMLFDAHVRGVDRAPGQTPIEFGVAAGERLAAPPFLGIAEAFDGARYGRHEPPDERIVLLERDLEAWEQAHPAPEGSGDEG